MESTLETVEALLVRRGFGVTVTFAWEISSSPSMSLLPTVSNGVVAFLGRPRTRDVFVAFGAFVVFVDVVDVVDVSAAAAAGTDLRAVLVFLGAGCSGSKSGDSSRAFDVKEISSSSSSDSIIGRLATRRDGREEAMTLKWAVAHGSESEEKGCNEMPSWSRSWNWHQKWEIEVKDKMAGPVGFQTAICGPGLSFVAGRICNRPLGRNRLCLDGPRAGWALFGNVPMRGL